MKLHVFFEIFQYQWHVIVLFFTIALLYASVGFGGGSSYLAVLALTGIAYTHIRSTALLCNIVVVSSNVFLYQKQGIYDWKKVIPLVSISIPMAFLGGLIRINQTFFFILLGIILLFSSVSMWISKNPETSRKSMRSNPLLKNSIYGGSIGFISGMVGIGGGIFLAPLLHLSKWDTSKKIAATASFFILVNSTAGFIGQSFNPDFSINWQLTSILVFAVLVGGQLGNRLSSFYFSANQLKKATALLIAFVSIRILIKYLL